MRRGALEDGQGLGQVVYRDDVGDEVKRVVLVRQLGRVVEIDDVAFGENVVARQLFDVHTQTCIARAAQHVLRQRWNSTTNANSIP